MHETPPSPDVLDIADAPQLFVEDTLLAASSGLQRRIHPMTKVSRTPVVRPTEPWDGSFLSPAAVHHDERAGQWRMWYVSYGKRAMTVPGLGGESMHVADSADGVHWEKPALGAFAAKTAPANNLCSFPDGAPAPAPCAVFDDPADPDPTRRFKMIYYLPSYYLAYSADGIRWRPAQRDPVWPNGSGDGLEETYFFLRDERRNKYRGYMRIWKRHQTVRKNGLGESDDLIHWTGPKVIWEAEPTFGVGSQLYGMNVFFDGGLYWALPWIYYTDQPLDPDVQQTMRFKLAWSRDGVDWTALEPEQDAVPLGLPGSFDCGMMLSSCPVIKLKDRIRLYYYGANIRHNVERVGGSAVGLAEIRRHGFVSLHAEEEGALITRRFLFRGEGLRLNARTAPGGYVLAEMLDDRGMIVKGREFAQADPFRGDAVDHLLTWRGDSRLASLFGQNVMLRLKLYQADLFSFTVDGPRERFTAPIGPHPVRCGRCVTPPVIDGILKDECWMDFTNSGVADDFVLFSEITPAPLKTRVMFTRDDENLYLSVDCEEPLTDQLSRKEPQGGIDYARDEVIEFRFSAPVHGTHFNQLMVTPAGAKMQAWFSVEEGGSWLVDQLAWTAKTSVIPGHWYLEMAVPFPALRTASPAPGEQWQMNVIRYRHVAGKDERSCWSCLFDSVHRNDRSGRLIFA